MVKENRGQAAHYVAELMVQQIQEKPEALLGLATGGTVVELYELLCAACRRGEVDFARARTVNLDEYVGLGPGHEQSFARFMAEHLFAKTNFDSRNIFLVNGALEEQAEVRRFDRFLERHSIDFLLLGVGSNGHIGFNEPGPVFEVRPHVAALTQETIDANARFFASRQQVPQKAITMGMRDVVRAGRVTLLAFGQGKAGAVRRLFGSEQVDPMLPCSILKLCGDCTVVVDQELADAAWPRGVKL